ncbi:MAG: hypothetical protein M3N22_04925 [Acidobacteriota bacterium]|nr:hypothetical protein [Acidobacteriota bacterium]
MKIFSFTLLFLAASRVAGDRGEQLFRKIESWFSRLARRDALVLAILFVSVIIIRVAILPLLPVPVPGIHDETSYLLQADTFAHGRLANPSHPMWRSFETFHVDWIPTYSSIYPPAQGFVLTIGQLLGLPWIGVLLSAAAMCSAIAWMLRAWMPARWGFLGGVLAALKFGFASYWMNSYWGGAVAAIGGALVLGTLPRIFRRPRVLYALILGLGVAILANSRPYEGFVLCLPAALCFFWWLAGKTKSPANLRVPLRTVLAPLLLILTLTATFMGYYNWRVTGSAFLMPHVYRTRNYHSSALFLWEHLRAPLHYNNQQFEDFYNGWERENYQTTWPSVWRVTKDKIDRDGRTFLWWGVLLLLPGFAFALFDKKIRLVVVTALLGTLAVFTIAFSFAHYAAPFTCAIVALLVQSIRHVRTFRIAAWPLGKWLSRAAVLFLIADTTSYIMHKRCDPLSWTCEGDPSRVAIQNHFSHLPGKHLVIVRYDQDHNIHDEWVYNGAEIDNAKVLWARELDQSQNEKLLNYFKDRQAWLVEPDTDNTALVPYSPPEQ